MKGTGGGGAILLETQSPAERIVECRERRVLVDGNGFGIDGSAMRIGDIDRGFCFEGCTTRDGSRNGRGFADCPVVVLDGCLTGARVVEGAAGIADDGGFRLAAGVVIGVASEGAAGVVAGLASECAAGFVVVVSVGCVAGLDAAVSAWSADGDTPSRVFGRSVVAGDERSRFGIGILFGVESILAYDSSEARFFSALLACRWASN